MSDLPKSIEILEVGPRDGLQIEKVVLSTDAKVKLIGQLADAGLKQIEVGSFVNPKAVPQMADSVQVFERLPKRPGVEYHGLWLNLRGLQQAFEVPNIHIEGKLSLTCSETFSKRNTNRTLDEQLEQIPQWIEEYRKHGVEAEEIGMMAAFGCNFEGYVLPENVVAFAARAADVMADNGTTLRRVLLADTMGWGTPEQTRRLIGLFRDRWPEIEIRLHLHDTRGTAVANAVAAMQMGVSGFDAAVGGLGGCPFAGHAGAAGNVCTEDLAFVAEEMGVSTGVDIDAMIAIARDVEELVGHPLPGKLMKSGSLTRFHTRQAA